MLLLSWYLPRNLEPISFDMDLSKTSPNAAIARYQCIEGDPSTFLYQSSRTLVPSLSFKVIQTNPRTCARNKQECHAYRFFHRMINDTNNTLLPLFIATYSQSGSSGSDIPPTAARPARTA